MPCEEYSIERPNYTNSYKIEYTPDEQQLADFYEGKLQPSLQENQYLLIKDTNGKIIDKYVKREGKLERLHYQTIESDYLGIIKPRNLEQELAIDLLKKELN